MIEKQQENKYDGTSLPTFPASVPPFCEYFLNAACFLDNFVTAFSRSFKTI